MINWTRNAAMGLVCISAVAPALAGERSFDRHFNISPGGELRLDTDVGSVVVVGRDGHGLDVHATVSGSHDFLSHFSITAVQDPQGVHVTGRMQPLGWLEQWFGSVGRRTVSYTIELPRDYATDIRTSGGSIDVRHLNADTRGRTSGGSITVEDVRGPLHMRTSGGGIRLERIDGSVQAVTSGGSVKAEVRTNRGVSLATSGGSIALRLAANATGTLNAHTSGGRVESTVPLSSVEVASRNELRGAFNGGGEPIRLRTSGGSIHIAPLE